MNVIEIQNLINQIGDLKTSFNQQTQEYSINETPVANINPKDNDALYGEYQIKLKNQLNQNSDLSLLKKLLLSVNRFEMELFERYHYFRIKLSESTNSNKDLIKICKIIDVKLDCLSQMKTDLLKTIQNFDFKLKTDFGDSESPIKETSFEEDELELAGLPTLNTQQRFELFKRLGLDKLIVTLDTSQATKNKIMAIILKISPDNAKKLTNGNYKEVTSKEIDFLDEYLLKLKIKL